MPRGLRERMSFDGFHDGHKEAFVAYDPQAAARFDCILGAIAQSMHVTCSGIERIPRGRALLVANHTFGWDVMFPMSAIRRELGRNVWALGEHAWWRAPFLRRAAATLGTVDGTPANVDRLLEKDELVLVLPGGLREAVKPRELRYRLLWGKRYGFVKAAIRNRAPIVPMACIGADDLFDFVGNAYRRGERLLRRTGIPIPLPARILPIPHLVKLEFVIGEPIAPPTDRAAADDPRALRRLRHEVEGAVHELIEIALARRSGIDVSA
jgi:1-acyl-sn-glycerol-3-phosphate acyltransferase